MGGDAPEETAITTERESDPVPHLARLSHHVVAQHACFPGTRMEERGEDPDRRRLACAVGPEESEDLPPRNLQGDPPECLYLALPAQHSAEAEDPPQVNALDRQFCRFHNHLYVSAERMPRRRASRCRSANITAPTSA